MDLDQQLDAYLASGYKLFPCHSITTNEFGEVVCTCPKGNACTSQGKHPRTRTGVKEATDNREMIQRWRNAFGDNQINWGLAQGAVADTFVVDVDPKDGGDVSWTTFLNGNELPDTLVATTGSGGKHLFFKYPGRKVGNRVGWRPGVDIRSDGGYVIAAPGQHISGGEYSWDNWGVRPKDAPDFLVDAIIGVGNGGIGAKPLPSNDQLIEGAPEGERDVLIFRAACRWRRELGDSDDARAKVTSMVLAMALKSSPPFPDDEALKKVEQAYAQDHSDDDLMVPFSGRPVNQPGSTDEDPIFETTEFGNRDRFIRAYGEKYRYVVGMGWHTWGDLGWQRQGDDGEVREAVGTVPDLIRDEITRLEMNGANARLVQSYRTWRSQSQTNAKVSAVVTLASTNSNLRRMADEFDSVPYELACRNGMVDLRTGELRPFTRDDLITKNTGVIYDPTYRLPAWEQFLHTSSLGDQDVMRYLQTAAGYTLSGSTAEECFFIISGPPRSGKTTFLDGLIAAMGNYHSSIDAEVFMSKRGREVDRSAMVAFYGPRLVATSELPEGSRFDDALLKRLTGGDVLSARQLYQEAFNFRPKFKLWMATNHDPITQDSAMFERIKRVPFSRTVPVAERDPHLKDIIKDPQVGGKAVLAWAVAGAVNYFQNGLRTPGTIVAATADYQDDQNTFRQFLNETFDKDDAGSMTLTSTFGYWKMWCDSNGTRYYGDRTTFAKRLEEHGKLQVTRGRDRTVMGIKLRGNNFAML